jgi:hypothetical protein
MDWQLGARLQTHRTKPDSRVRLLRVELRPTTIKPLAFRLDGR